MKKLSISVMIACLIVFFAACGGGNNQSNESSSADSTTEEVDTEDVSSYDPHRGEGKYEHDYDPGAVDQELVAGGLKIYDAKCRSCHKLSNEMLVGPGWEGVTDKHSAAWILNFLSNTDEMIDQDPELQKQLEICMVRMPNQNLTDKDAHEIYDFMRDNDGKK